MCVQMIHKAPPNFHRCRRCNGSLRSPSSGLRFVAGSHELVPGHLFYSWEGAKLARNEGVMLMCVWGCDGGFYIGRVLLR